MIIATDSNRITILAQAKINLYLDILSRNADGYHNILSVMQSVGLADKLNIALLNNEEGICLSVDTTDVPSDKTNLAYKAAELFSEPLGYLPNVKIDIEKHIPVAGGLAGGSSDAAAVLRGLNILYKTNLNLDELCYLGKRLGADVPFCIKGGSMIAKGIGDILTPCDGLSENQWIVIACGGEKISTPAAYRALDIKYENFELKRDNKIQFDLLCDLLRRKRYNNLEQHRYNIFEEVVLPQHSIADKALYVLKESGAYAAFMSGSGPSVCGLFALKEMAEKAKDNLKTVLPVEVFVTQSAPTNND